MSSSSNNLSTTSESDVRIETGGRGENRVNGQQEEDSQDQGDWVATSTSERMDNHAERDGRKSSSTISRNPNSSSSSSQSIESSAAPSFIQLPPSSISNSTAATSSSTASNSPSPNTSTSNDEGYAFDQQVRPIPSRPSNERTISSSSTSSNRSSRSAPSSPRIRITPLSQSPRTSIDMDPSINSSHNLSNRRSRATWNLQGSGFTPTSKPSSRDNNSQSGISGVSAIERTGSRQSLREGSSTGTSTPQHPYLDESSALSLSRSLDSNSHFNHFNLSRGFSSSTSSLANPNSHHQRSVSSVASAPATELSSTSNSNASLPLSRTAIRPLTSYSPLNSRSSPQLNVSLGFQSADEGGISDAPPPYEPSTSASTSTSNLLSMSSTPGSSAWPIGQSLSTSRRVSPGRSTNPSQIRGLVRASTAPPTAQNSDAEEDWNPTSSSPLQPNSVFSTSPSAIPLSSRRSPIINQSPQVSSNLNSNSSNNNSSNVNHPFHISGQGSSRRRTRGDRERGRDSRIIASASTSRRTSPAPHAHSQTQIGSARAPNAISSSRTRRRSDSLGNLTVGGFGLGLGLTSISNNSSSTEDELVPGTNSSVNTWSSHNSIVSSPNAQNCIPTSNASSNLINGRRRRAATHDGSAEIPLFSFQRRSSTTINQAINTNPPQCNLEETFQRPALDSSESSEGPLVDAEEVSNHFTSTSNSRIHPNSVVSPVGNSTALEAAEALLNWRGGSRAVASSGRTETEGEAEGETEVEGTRGSGGMTEILEEQQDHSHISKGRTLVSTIGLLR